METITFEDGSGLQGDDSCVFYVRDEGVWMPAETGRTYYDADGSPWIGCAPSMPDTSIPAPEPFPLDGLALVLILIVLSIRRGVKLDT